MMTIINKYDYGHIYRLDQKLILYTSKVSNMKKISSVLKTGILIMVPFAGLAHPGHGETEGFSIIHYFTEPVHALVSVLLLAGIIYTVSYTRRKKSGEKKA
jgi:hypothetical protein